MQEMAKNPTKIETKRRGIDYNLCRNQRGWERRGRCKRRKIRRAAIPARLWPSWGGMGRITASRVSSKPFYSVERVLIRDGGKIREWWWRFATGFLRKTKKETRASKLATS